jgi:hypothetical protein
MGEQMPKIRKFISGNNGKVVVDKDCCEVVFFFASVRIRPGLANNRPDGEALGGVAPGWD